MNYQNFFSPGKLMLTGEYFVLDGAVAFAMPTRLGQSLMYHMEPSENARIVWEAYVQGKAWLSVEIDFEKWEIIHTNIPEAGEFVLRLMKIIQENTTDKFCEPMQHFFRSNLEFPANFGLGSSSTLMNNLARWSGVNAFLLNNLALGGSGYDIAVAIARQAVLYRIKNQQPDYSLVDFAPSFLDDLLLVYLDKKQNSRHGIRDYKEIARDEDAVFRISEISEAVLACKNLADFSGLMTEHERIVSEHLKRSTVKDLLFEDCPVFVKSLGAWGGDFVLTQRFDDDIKYFSKKGFSTVLAWHQLMC